MAKSTKSVSFSNAIIDIDEDTITETKKDECTTWNLSDVLKQFNGLPGVSLMIRYDDALPGELEEEI